MELMQAIAEMGVTLEDTGGALGGLQCVEVDAIARVLALAGHMDKAVAVVIDHAVGDAISHDGDIDEDDLHTHVAEGYSRDLATGNYRAGEAGALAEEYVRTLLGDAS